MQKISEVINQFVSANELTDAINLQQIKQIWQEDFPNTISQNISVTNLKNSILYLHTSSSAWRKEILLRKIEIINKINLKLASEIISDLTI